MHRAPTSALRQLTDLVRDVGALTKVIKRPAPNGALRLHRAQLMRREVTHVIKHQAPNGALRHIPVERADDLS